MGSLLSMLDLAILQYEGQAIARLCHYTALDSRVEFESLILELREDSKCLVLLWILTIVHQGYIKFGEAALKHALIGNHQPSSLTIDFNT